MAMIAARNRSSHTYNEKTANEIAEAILTSFAPRFADLLAKFTELAKQEP